MRKLSYFGLFAAVSLFAASCAMEEDHVIFDLNKATSPSITSIQGATLSSDGAPISFNFNLPDYQLASGTTYALFAGADQALSDPQKLSATIGTDGTVSIKQSDLNSMILNLGGEAEKEFTLYFRLSSWLANDKGNAVESSLLYSNIVSATFIPYDMTVLDKDIYQTVWVQGDYCGWSHDKSQFLYNYSKDGKTFSGVVDFAGKASGGIKFTGAASWDNSTGNWGSEAQAEDAEAGSVQLINGDGSKNLVCYSKRFYKFSMDNTTLLLTKEWGADKIGIVGTINGWAAPDVEMNYNADYVRFWADVEIDGDQEIKFRADEDWTWNWGADAKVNGDNIKVSTGKYRVYLDLNKGIVELNEKMYGQQEPSASGDEPQPDKPASWSLIGTLYGSSWDSDFDLTNTSGDIWQIRSVEITASDEFKIRADHDWSNNVGGPEANSESTIDPSNPYGVYKPELGKAFATGGNNIQVGVAGVYDITFDYANSTILIEEHNAAYALIGEIDGDSWSKDVLMTQNGDIWTSPVVNITGGFKIRYDYSWDDANCYGAPAGFTPVIGEEFTAEQPGSNITVPEPGDYKVSFNAATKAVTIVAVAFPETMYMIGQDFGGWDWNSDGIVSLTPVHSGEGQFWTVRYIKAGVGFKFCSKREWNGDFWGLETNDGFTEQGGNCVVDKDGLYLIHIDLKNGKVHVEPARIYGIGDCFGGWNEGMENALFTNDGQTTSAKLAADGQVRMYVASDIATTDWWTREFIILDGKIVYRGTGDDQERVACKAGQTVTLDFNAGTGSIN
ncbi:MAG: SusE domain-containing protein [Bacteroidia bacterium]|nr:SusE domain-containing protein [Bacteroidia bacterium]